MIELRLLGGATVGRTGGVGRAPLSLPPKPLALLGYLAVAAPHRLHRRDLLLPLLWPDLDASRARNALSQTLFRIRTVVGDSLVQSVGTEEIRVEPASLWCDAWEFEASCRSRRWEAALDLYQGEFLAGLHVSGAPGFERWQDMERARFRRLAHQAALSLAEQQREAGHTSRAALWLRRALEIVPDDEGALRLYMGLLEEAGEPAGALAAYEEQRRYLLRELDLEMGPETQALAERIRAGVSRRQRRARRAPAPEAATVTAPPTGISALAVLPFRNLTGHPEEDYFADGMSDALITALGRMRNARVISRQSSLAYRGTEKSLPRIAEELCVDAVVEGSVLRVGNRIRITAQLIRARPEAHLWAESYERMLEDVLEIHQEVARSIAEHVEGKIPLREQPPATRPQRVDPDAYEAFLKGRHYSAMWPQIGRGVAYFERAIERDPRFAPAHAALAICYFHMATFVLLSPAEAHAALDSAARDALALDDSLAEAHVAMALSLGISRRDWPYETERELRRAIELDPNNAFAHAYLGGHRVALGDEGGLAGCERAVSLDPLNPWILHNLGWARYRMRRYERAEQTFRGILESYPHLALPHPFLAQVYLQQGRTKDAVEACRRSRDLSPDDSLVLGYGAAILALAGERQEAEAWKGALVSLADRRYVDPYYLAAAWAALGDQDGAFAWLDRMCTEASTSFWLLKTDPLFDSLRADPRFDRVLERLGFWGTPR